MLALGVEAFLDLEGERLEDVGAVDLVFDVIGGDILRRSAAVVRPGGTLVSVAEPPPMQPEEGRATFFVVEANRSQLAALARRLRDGRLTVDVAAVRPLAEAPAAFDRTPRACPGTTVVRVTEGW